MTQSELQLVTTIIEIAALEAGYSDMEEIRVKDHNKLIIQKLLKHFNQ